MEPDFKLHTLTKLIQFRSLRICPNLFKDELFAQAVTSQKLAKSAEKIKVLLPIRFQLVTACAWSGRARILSDKLLRQSL